MTKSAVIERYQSSEVKRSEVEVYHECVTQKMERRLTRAPSRGKSPIEHEPPRGHAILDYKHCVLRWPAGAAVRLS